MLRDACRIDSIQSMLREESLDAMVCTLPANVLLLTGYWPVVGTSLAVVAPGPRTLLIVPEDEYDLASRGWADEVRTFRPGSLDDVHTPEEAIAGPLGEVSHSLGSSCRRIGYENGGSIEPTSYAAMHLFGADILKLLSEAFHASHLIPVARPLAELWSVKTPLEIECIRNSCLIAAAAFQRGASDLTSGLTERQAAERFHAGMCESGSTGHSSRVGGFTWCMSGPNSAKAWAAYARSGPRTLIPEDLVLIHCNSYLDGFWTDISRTYCLDRADERKQQMYDAVFAARDAALEIIRPGVQAKAVDAAARSVLSELGWGAAFKHAVGHGVGFGAINAQALPRLHPNSDDILRPGMVFNLEPALYFEGYGGLRHCDMVALTQAGAEVLTPFQLSRSELIRR